MNYPSSANLPISVLEQLECAYDIVADVLRQAPQLHQTRLDQALLVLSLSMERARRSPALRPKPRWRQQEMDF
jgi:hypothetical protein